MVTARLAAAAVHALLHHAPGARARNEEAVQVEREAVLHGRAVHLGHQPALAGQLGAVETGALADAAKLRRCLARVFAAPAAHVEPQLLLHGLEPAFERTE